MSAEDITKAFYKIACSFNVSASAEYTTVTIEGLQENFDKAVSLFEDLMTNCKADDAALKSLKARTAKSRSDAKLNKGSIMNALTSYARYGASNPFNNSLTNDEVANITSAELVDRLHELKNYSHKILYYGPKPLVGLTASLKTLHTVPLLLKLHRRKKYLHR